MQDVIQPGIQPFLSQFSGFSLCWCRLGFWTSLSMFGKRSLGRADGGGQYLEQGFPNGGTSSARDTWTTLKRCTLPVPGLPSSLPRLWLAVPAEEAVNPTVVQLCPGASIEGDRGALLMGIHRSLCPSAAEQGGLRRARRSRGAGVSLLRRAHGSCRLWGRGSPSSAMFHEPARPSVTISSIFRFVSRGTFQVTFCCG